MRALLVVNPAATTTSARTREVLASALEAELKLEVAHTRHRGHAAELAREARDDGLDLVVALGGDGTVNEVVNGLLADGPHAQVPDLAVVPGGGTNVFARALGSPATRSRRPARCSTRCGSTAAAASGSASPATAGSRSTPGMGWDAEVVARVDRRRRARPTGRHTTPTDYVRAALAQFFLHTDRRHPVLTPGAAGRGAGPAAHGDRRQHRALDLPRRPARCSPRRRRRSTPAWTSTP